MSRNATSVERVADNTPRRGRQSSPLWERIHRRYFMSQNFYKTLEPLFLCTFVNGITPFRVTTNRSGTKALQSSWCGFLNLLLHMAAFAYCYAHALLHNESIIGCFLRTGISEFGSKLHSLSGLLAVVVVYISAIVERHRLEHILQLLLRVDRSLERARIRFAYTVVLRYVLAVLAVMALLSGSLIAICLWCLERMNGDASPYVLFIFVGELLGVSSLIALFCLMARSVELRIDIVNKVLKNLAHQWDSSRSGGIKPPPHKQRSLQCLDSFSMYNIATKNPSDIVQESMEIHYLICEAAATANKYFTYQLLTIISIAFLIIVFDAYYVLETLLGKSKRESKFKTVEFVTFFSCQMILYIIAIVSIVEGSDRAIKKSEKTGSIVHALLNKAKTADVKEKLQQFSMQLNHLKINFTAAGLFNIDRTLYFTISGALTTYLIILLQFTANTPNALTSGTPSDGGIDGLAMANATANQTMTI